MNAEDITLENRRSLYRYIREHPGLHLRGISRDLDMNIGTLRHHIKFLERNRIVVSKKDGNLKVFFAARKLNADDKRISLLLQQKRLRNIILVIIITPGLTHGEISEKLSIKPSTLSKYVKILHEKKVLYFEKNRNEKRYFVRSEKEIVELLMTYKKSFWDSFVDNMLEIYFEQ
ncbi:MAG: winged helix-turn-helix transcriptional regulator [Thermoplasmata archaeon]|nr:winged helix-turn-helix transcriptional regulator [Thermoplasmata archaeon]